MTRSYNQSGAPTASSFGKESRLISPDSGTDFSEVAKAITVTDVSGGDVLKFLPEGNADPADEADPAWVTYSGVPVGLTPPFKVRRVSVQTTCTVRTVEG